jgi:hypothetical protein
MRAGVAIDQNAPGHKLRRALLMDAIALAQALDGTRQSDGAISLRQLQTQLSASGLKELARAVESLTGRLTPAKLRIHMDTVIVPWF